MQWHRCVLFLEALQRVITGNGWRGGDSPLEEGLSNHRLFCGACISFRNLELDDEHMLHGTRLQGSGVTIEHWTFG